MAHNVEWEEICQDKKAKQTGGTQKHFPNYEEKENAIQNMEEEHAEKSS